jgi:hypothetical protein
MFCANLKFDRSGVENLFCVSSVIAVKFHIFSRVPTFLGSASSHICGNSRSTALLSPCHRSTPQRTTCLILQTCNRGYPVSTAHDDRFRFTWIRYCRSVVLWSSRRRVRTVSGRESTSTLHDPAIWKSPNGCIQL